MLSTAAPRRAPVRGWKGRRRQSSIPSPSVLPPLGAGRSPRRPRYAVQAKCRVRSRSRPFASQPLSAGVQEAGGGRCFPRRRIESIHIEPAGVAAPAHRSGTPMVPRHGRSLAASACSNLASTNQRNGWLRRGGSALPRPSKKRHARVFLFVTFPVASPGMPGTSRTECGFRIDRRGGSVPFTQRGLTAPKRDGRMKSLAVEPRRSPSPPKE
jgi:hypothetical protein